MDASRPTQLPSRLALALRAPLLGVISKIDLATEDNLRKARASLAGAGVKEIVEISSVTGQGLDDLNVWITGSSDPAQADQG
jgi:ethanolamine utilization protein EutP